MEHKTVDQSVELARRPLVSCTVEGCSRTFTRVSDKNRHMQSHKTPEHKCPFWDYNDSCHRKDGAFNRLDTLRRHLRLVHLKRDQANLDGTSGWCKVCGVYFEDMKTFTDHCPDCATGSRTTNWDIGAGAIAIRVPKYGKEGLTVMHPTTNPPTLLSLGALTEESCAAIDEL